MTTTTAAEEEVEVVTEAEEDLAVVWMTIMVEADLEGAVDLGMADLVAATVTIMEAAVVTEEEVRYILC